MHYPGKKLLESGVSVLQLFCKQGTKTPKRRVDGAVDAARYRSVSQALADRVASLSGRALRSLQASCLQVSGYWPTPSALAEKDPCVSGRGPRSRRAPSRARLATYPQQVLGAERRFRSLLFCVRISSCHRPQRSEAGTRWTSRSSDRCPRAIPSCDTAPGLPARACNMDWRSIPARSTPSTDWRMSPGAA